MPIENDDLNLLLIEEYPAKLALIRQALDTRKVRCNLSTIGTGKSALSFLKQLGPFKNAPSPDLVLFDFSEPDRTDWSLLRKLATYPSPIATPLVILTSRRSEELLKSGYEDKCDSSLFAPVDLTAFLQRMAELPPGRFVKALSLISKLGLIVVRLPCTYMNQRDPELTDRSA